MSVLTTSIQHQVLTNAKRQDKEIKGIHTERNLISKEKLSQFSKVIGYKVNIQRPAVFQYYH